MKSKEYYQKTYWDKERPLPGDGTPAKQISRLHQLINRHTPFQSIILDVGCGDGRYYGETLQQLAHLHVGVDISETALQRAHQINIQGVILDVDVALPFPSNMFDTAVCIDVMEHLFNPEFLACELHRVLKPDCSLIASVPNIAHYPHRLRAVGGKFVAGGLASTAHAPWRDPHIRFFTVRSLKDMMSAAGFRSIEVYGANTAFLVGMPFISVSLKRLIGTEKLKRLSDKFEPIGHIWPSLFASKLIAVGKVCK